jgi:hypothetical protein
MPANGRLDLIRRLRVNLNLLESHFSVIKIFVLKLLLIFKFVLLHLPQIYRNMFLSYGTVS